MMHRSHPTLAGEGTGSCRSGAGSLQRSTASEPGMWLHSVNVVTLNIPCFISAGRTVAVLAKTPTPILRPRSLFFYRARADFLYGTVQPHHELETLLPPKVSSPIRASEFEPRFTVPRAHDLAGARNHPNRAMFFSCADRPIELRTK